MSNVLGGYGVLRFSKTSKTYLDINPVSYLNEKSTYAIFVVARLIESTSGVQYLVADNTNGLRIFFNGSKWCFILSRARLFLSCGILTDCAHQVCSGHWFEWHWLQ
jgi:hypothetical protein